MVGRVQEVRCGWEDYWRLGVVRRVQEVRCVWESYRRLCVVGRVIGG